MASAGHACRGMARFDGRLPDEMPQHTFRFIFGRSEGLAGVYPVSDSDIFYFFAFPAPEARPRPPITPVQLRGACCPNAS